MKKRPTKDVAASVRQKLLNNAKATNRPFQEVRQYFAMERFLYRLAESPHADKFILKGALMFTVWGAPSSRPTRDIDFLARTKNSIETVVPLIRSVCIQPVQPDLGYGDVIVPGATLADYPAILDFPVPRLRTYSRETVVAEKFEAMVKLGQLNSRLKDFFDVWLLSRQANFSGATLATAIGKTFENRKTTIPAEALALTPPFADDPAKRTQWKGFLKKSRLDNAPADLHEVLAALRFFLRPLAMAVREAQPFTQSWIAPGPWRVG